jgi:hypothetical protein
MRKTLAILVLTISSLLFLAGPAWAHQLYKIKKGSYVALSDCNENKILISSREDAPFQAWTRQRRTVKYGTKDVNQFLLDDLRSEDVRFNPKKLKARCGTGDHVLTFNEETLLDAEVPKTSLPFTGRPLVPQLLLGIGLLLVGSLFVALTVHPSLAAGLRRRRPRPTTPS